MCYTIAFFIYVLHKACMLLFVSLDFNDLLFQSIKKYIKEIRTNGCLGAGLVIKFFRLRVSHVRLLVRIWFEGIDTFASHLVL